MLNVIRSSKYAARRKIRGIEQECNLHLVHSNIVVAFPSLKWWYICIIRVQK